MNFLTTESTEHTEKEESNSLTGKIIGAAMEVHRFNVRALKEGIRRLKI